MIIKGVVMKTLLTAVMAAGLALATAAHAAMVITVTEVDGDVVMTGSGKVFDENRDDLNGPGSRYEAGSRVFDDLSENYAFSLSGSSDVMTVTSNVYGAVVTSFSSVELDHDGDDYGFYTSTDGGYTQIFTAGDHVEENPIKFTWTFSGFTVETLGTVFGTVFDTGTNSLVIEDGRPVPVPGALPLFLGVIGAGAAWRRKQR